MKPHLSPINCITYFVTDLRFTANSLFNPEKETNVAFEELRIESDLVAPPKEGDNWLVSLTIAQEVPAEKNAPYNFALDIVGFFSVLDGLPEDRQKQIVQTNGSSILYGAAREILRDVTAKGPYEPILLPTVSFFPLKKPPVTSESEKAENAEPSPAPDPA